MLAAVVGSLWPVEFPFSIFGLADNTRSKFFFAQIPLLKETLGHGIADLDSPVYLKTIHNQLSAIFNHAVRYYNLRGNPAAKAGNMGSEERTEMLFWTKEE